LVLVEAQSFLHKEVEKSTDSLYIRQMAELRSRKNKEHPHYNFLVSWTPKPPSQARVKREQASDKIDVIATLRHGKMAESMAQAAPNVHTKKSIVRSLILIGFILILELVIYLARNRFGLS